MGGASGFPLEQPAQIILGKRERGEQLAHRKRGVGDVGRQDGSDFLYLAHAGIWPLKGDQILVNQPERAGENAVPIGA